LGRSVKLVSVFATEDWVCFEYIASGTIAKHPPRYPDSLSRVGKTFELPACLVFHLTDGKIDLIREYFDLSNSQR
jgi:ketosteroid isomerase-like protein